MIGFNNNKEWVKFVQLGQLDEAYRIYLSHKPTFKFFSKFSFRRSCAQISLIIAYFIKVLPVKFDSEDNAVDLSDEFLIFWKCPDVMGRFLLKKIIGHYLKTGTVPVRALAWYGHWLVFQGKYGEALTLFRYALNSVSQGSRLHGEILSFVGNYFYSRGKFENSIQIHEKSNTILRYNGDKFFQMFNLGTSAKVYAELGDLEGFNKNILAGYDQLDPKEPDERYGMRVLIYGAYLNYIAGNNSLARQFYYSGEKCFQKSGSPLDKAIYCTYKSVILLFFRDLNGARTNISQARTFLKGYGNYKVYEELICSLQKYFNKGDSSLRITNNLLYKDGVTVRSELESWYSHYFTMVLPLLEKFQKSDDVYEIISPLEQATVSFASISLIKDEIKDIGELKEARFIFNETENGSSEFVVDLFHRNKFYEMRLLSSFKKWRNPEIIEAIRSTLFQLQNISKEDQLRSIFFSHSQRMKENEVARRIAHDIRSPLAALQIAVSSLDAVIPDYSIIKTSTQRIEDIANSLTRKRETDGMVKKEKVLVKSFMDSLVATKRFEYHKKGSVIEIQYSNQSAALYIDVNELELSRTLSNVINNAIESYDEGGLVKLIVDSQGGCLVVHVEDRGCGISYDHIEKVFAKDFSMKKGSGLGLFYAKQFLESNGGAIRINSKLGTGTSVILSYPISAPPGWIKTMLFLEPFEKIIIVDDFVPNIEMMRAKITKHCPEKQILSFSDLTQFKSYLDESEDISKSFFVIDHEFVNSSETGVDVILSHSLNGRSVLATHHYENEELIRRCKEGCVRIVPKIIFDDIRIIDEKPHVFIIDDEKYFLKAIKNKLEKKFYLHLFESGNGLLEKADTVVGKTFFFVDRNFDNSESNGEGILSALAEKGMIDLYNISEDISFVHPNAVKIRKHEIEHYLT